MLDEAPHILQKCIKAEPILDRAGRQIGETEERWEDVAECFCHDNSQMEQISVNGELWTYAYHVVYEGDMVALGTKVQCTDKSSGELIGHGVVRKIARCHSFEFQGRTDLWLE